jgi:hypothetical protein
VKDLLLDTDHQREGVLGDEKLRAEARDSQSLYNTHGCRLEQVSAIRIMY